MYVPTGPDLQTKAWVGHCACVVETGLTTYSIAQANQKAVVSIASMQNMLLLGGFGGMPPRTFFLNYML